MPRLKETIIVTGGAGGIGTGFLTSFLATPFASEYHGIYIHHPSSSERLPSLLGEEASKGDTYELVPLDLSLQSSIHTFCTSINARVASGELGKIRILMLIAGGIFTSRTDGDGVEFSSEGIEMAFAVNYVANFLLSTLLLPSLCTSTSDIEGKGDGRGRGEGEGAKIILLSSTTHDPSFKSNAFAIRKPEHHVLFESVESLSKGIYQPVEGGDRFAGALRRYGCAKLCGVLFMYEYQRHLSSNPAFKTIKILAHDPGAVGGTNHYETQTFPLHLYIMLKYLMVPIQAISCFFWPGGAMRTTGQVGKDLCFMAFEGGLEGGSYVDGRTVVQSSAESRDVGKQGRLWKETLGLVGMGGIEGLD